jgi:hypothetical protein
VWLDSSEGQKGRVIAGMLTQQVQKGDENLEIGIVTQARFIRDTLTLLDSPTQPVPAPATVSYASDTSAAKR